MAMMPVTHVSVYHKSQTDFLGTSYSQWCFTIESISQLHLQYNKMECQGVFPLAQHIYFHLRM